MVILVVCLWREPTANCWHEPDTEATETNGNRMPFIACLCHLCRPRRRSWTLQGLHGVSLSAYISTVLVHLCTYGKCVAARSGWTVSYCHTGADTAPTATGHTWRVRAVHQLLMLECRMQHTHARTYTLTPHAHNCIFVHSIPYTCAHVYIQSRMGHMLQHVTHGAQCTNAYLYVHTQPRKCEIFCLNSPGTQWTWRCSESGCICFSILWRNNVHTCINNAVLGSNVPTRRYFLTKLQIGSMFLLILIIVLIYYREAQNDVSYSLLIWR